MCQLKHVSAETTANTVRNNNNRGGTECQGALVMKVKITRIVTMHDQIEVFTDDETPSLTKEANGSGFLLVYLILVGVRKMYCQLLR